MKKILLSKIIVALKSIATENSPEIDAAFNRVVVEEPRDPSHGHLASNAAMVMSKILRLSPQILADKIIQNIDNNEGFIEKMDKAGPGFINFSFSLKWWAKALEELLAEGDNFGNGSPKNLKVMVEYVSANPTGPLHVGHGRGAAIGDALCRLMKKAGYEVMAEYYINDAGHQMHTLGESLFLRLVEKVNSNFQFPDTHYKGDYIIDLAEEYAKSDAEALKLAKDFVNSDEAIVHFNEKQTKLVNRLADFAQNRIIEGIKSDLKYFKVGHDNWFSEKSLHLDGMIDKALENMRTKGFIYEKDGAVWFSSEALADDKDRVIIKSDGEKTYFAADIAYHWNKFKRGFDLLIDVWGADHHGYVPRMKAAIEALGRKREDFAVLLVQMVSLFKAGEAVSMSTRGGEYVTLKELIDEVGVDAARFIFLSRSSDSTLDFDLDLAKSQTKDNPVYYVQYAGARIESILRGAESLQAEQKKQEKANLNLLDKPEEIALIKHLRSFPDLIENSASKREPHHLTNYLSSLARQFHHYYGLHRIAVENDSELSKARFSLVKAIRLVIRLGLDILGVSSPEAM